MSLPYPTVRRLFALTSVAVLTSCGGGGSEPTGPRPDAPTLLSASDVTVDVLPLPPGVSIGQTRGVSEAGYIFGISVDSDGASAPYVWERPYTSAPLLMTSTGFLRGLDGPTATGDIPGSRDGANGFWSRVGSDWAFIAASAASYIGSVVSGVNSSHAMTGWGHLNGTQRALWWSSPTAQPAELPWPSVSGGTVTAARALALSDGGTVVGEITVATERTTRSYAVLWTSGVSGWSAVVLPGGGTNTRAYDINEAGQVAGNGGSGAMLWTPSGGTYVATVASSSQGALTRLDECGRLIGYTSTTTPSKRRAYVWENGVITVLPIPSGMAATEAQEIGADPVTGRGIVVGRALTKSGAAVPVRWTIPGCP